MSTAAGLGRVNAECERLDLGDHLPWGGNEHAMREAISRMQSELLLMREVISNPSSS
jgi:hypothetical protein